MAATATPLAEPIDHTYYYKKTDSEIPFKEAVKVESKPIYKRDNSVNQLLNLAITAAIAKFRNEK